MLVSNLKKLTSTLLDIHGQHENQNMLDPLNHINYLDYYAHDKIAVQLGKYKSVYEKLNGIRNKIRNLSGIQGENDKIADFMKYQIDEINKAKLIEGEDEELQKRISVLSNAEKISGILNNSYSILYNGDENKPSTFDELGSVIRDFRVIENNHEDLKKITQELQDTYYSLEGAVEEIRNFKEDIYYDENELDDINQRIFQISGLKKKYGKSIKEILEYKDEISTQFDELVNRTEIIEKLRKEEEELIKDIKKQAENIHNIRCAISKQLEQRIKKELSYIGLEKSVFKINIEVLDKFMANGFDKVQYLISTNPGEPVKP